VWRRDLQLGDLATAAVNDNQLNSCSATQADLAKALQEGVTIFYFFQKYNSR